MQKAGYQQQRPYGQPPNMPYGQPMQQAAPTYNQPVQPSQPQIVGYDTQTGAPIYEKQ